jgi:hypothetical protein
VKDHQHVCDHGVPYPEYCAHCDEPWPRPEPLELVRGGQGKSAENVGSCGVWAGVAILALSAGTVVWMLLRWFSRF